MKTILREMGGGKIKFNKIVAFVMAALVSCSYISCDIPRGLQMDKKGTISLNYEKDSCRVRIIVTEIISHVSIIMKVTGKCEYNFENIRIEFDNKSYVAGTIKCELNKSYNSLFISYGVINTTNEVKDINTLYLIPNGLIKCNGENVLPDTIPINFYKWIYPWKYRNLERKEAGRLTEDRCGATGVYKEH